MQQHAASFIAHTAASTGSALLRFSKEEIDAFLECGILAHVIPQVPVRQWVLSLPIPRRLLLAAQPKLVTSVLQVVQRVVMGHLLDHADLKVAEGHRGAVTLIQRFGSAANLNIHLHCLVLDGVYRCGGDGVPVFVEAGAPSDDELSALLHMVITRLMKMHLGLQARAPPRAPAPRQALQGA